MRQDPEQQYRTRRIAGSLGILLGVSLLIAASGFGDPAQGPTAQVPSSGFKDAKVRHTLASISGGNPICETHGFSTVSYCNLAGTVESCGWTCQSCVSNCTPVAGQASTQPVEVGHGYFAVVRCDQMGSYAGNRWCGFFCTCSGGLINEIPCDFRHMTIFNQCID